MEEEHEGEVGDSRAEEEGGRGMEGELSSSRGGGRRRRARVDAGSREDKKEQKVAKVSFSPISSLESPVTSRGNKKVYFMLIKLPSRRRRLSRWEYGELHRRLRPALNPGLRLLCQGLWEALLAAFNAILLPQIKEYWATFLETSLPIEGLVCL